MNAINKNVSGKKIHPRFRPEEGHGFFACLNDRVRPLIKQYDSHTVWMTSFKVVIYPALYVGSWLLLIWKGAEPLWTYGAYLMMGLMVTMNVFNLVHDAVHGALFRKRWKNKLTAHLLDLMGGNSYVWSIRHVWFHHTFTNVPDWDIDIKQTNVVRFIPDSKFRSQNHIQWLYMPVLYLFYSLKWILHRDFQDFFSSESIVRAEGNIPTKEYAKLFLFKLFYITYALIIPMIVLTVGWGHLVIGFLVMHMATSALTLLVLLPSHLDEHAHFPRPDDGLDMQDTWATHQLKVTNDFGTDNALLNFIMGGLNHHIAHHLFPHANHNVIPRITEHIRFLAPYYGLPYRHYSLLDIMTSHFKLLKKNSIPPANMNDF